MKFTCALYVVEDVDKSKKFYESLLGQKVKYDFGENVTFEGNFSIHQSLHFSEMVSVDPKRIFTKSNNSELYFETEDISAFTERLENSEYEIEYLHKLREHSWAQRVIRFYDLDKHIIEVGEQMESVVKRLLHEGKSVEEVAAKTQYPVSFVEKMFSGRE